MATRPSANRPTLSGQEIGARVLTHEAFLIALIKRSLPKSDAEGAKEDVAAMVAAAKKTAADLGHPEVQVQVEMYANDLAERLLAPDQPGTPVG